MLFVGLGCLSWRARDLAPSSASKVIFQSFAISMAGAAALGIVVFLRGNVGPEIRIAFLAELFFTITFARLARAIS